MHNFDNLLFRCSGLGHIMTEPRSKSETLSASTKTHLIDLAASFIYKRREEVRNKYLAKGNEREEDSTTLLSVVLNKFLLQNSERLSNEYITGEIDIFEGKSIENADEITDTKTSYSLHTFLHSKFDELNKMYYCQGQGYMWLSKAKKCNIAYCLVNGTDKAIMDEKRKLQWQLGVIDPDNTDNEKYINGCKQIEINHIFDINAFNKEYPWFEYHNKVIINGENASWDFDIPKKDRVHIKSFERDDEFIDKMKQRIIDCRKWLNDNFNEASKA